MALTIDELNIQITADSKNATRALTSLIKKLEKLKETLNGSAISNITIANSFNKTTNSINKAATATQNYDNKTKKSTKSTKSFSDKLAQNISKWRTLHGAFQSAAQTMAGWFQESNDYIETLNLFEVAMGSNAKAAKAYAETVQDAMGIDSKDWMNYQAIFQNLATGFGVTNDAATVMSRNLTQLSYDLSSIYNKDVEEAFDKLSSAMSGQVKGLREYGIDTTVATLQEYALSKGIDASVRSMSQAEKSLLRYNYIMEQSRDLGYWNDMAKTIITPANSLRILTAQITQMKRALGNIISVLITQVIPYVQAFVELLTVGANRLANLFGFELPDLNGNQFSQVFGDAEEDAEGVEGSIKKIKKQLMGFDELNIISNPESDGGASGGAGGGSLGGMDLLEYDFLKGLNTSKVDEIKEKMKTILECVGLIGVGIVGWKLGSFIAGLATAGTKATGLLESVKLLGKKIGITAGVTLVVSGITLETKGIVSAIKEGLNGVNFTEILGGGGILIGGAALLGAQFGQTLLFSGIGAIIAGVPMFITGIYDAIMNGLDWLNGILIPAGASLTGAGIGAIIGMLGGPIGAGIGALIGLAVGLVTDLVILIVQNWEAITAWCSEACAAIGQFFVGLWEGIQSVWGTVATWFNTAVIQPIVLFFTGLWEGISLAASTCWDAIVGFFTPAFQWFSELFGSIGQTISDIFYNIGVIASGCWEIIKTVWGIVKDWFNEKVITPVATFFTNLWQGIKNTAQAAWEGIKSIYTTVSSWINEKIIQPVSKFFTGLWDGFKEGAKKAWEGVKSVFSTVATFFKNIFTDAWKGIVKVFSVAGEIFVNIKDGIVSAFKWVVNGIIRGINSVVSIPFGAINDALMFLKNLEILGIEPFKNIQSIHVPQIPLLASGGVVDAGQMFIAREAGPELVGQIGNKTAVANNDQIISGIEAGVYKAVVAANSGNKGGTQTIRIINEIDGDVIGEKVIQYHNGKVMQTGASPLLV